MTIASPKHPADHPDRIVDCEFAMEPAFQAFAAEAIAAGWSEHDVSTALLNLAVANVKGIMSHFATEADIATAKKMIRAMKGKP